VNAIAKTVGVVSAAPAVKWQRAKQAPAVSKKLDADGVSYCLECWKDWMHADADRDLGASTMRGLVGDSDGYGSDSNVYDDQQRADMEIGAATDAMIESLKTLHIWAIYKMCGIATAWRYQNADLLLVGPEARNELERKLRNNCCTARLF
jgi:hypothetical protein